MMKSSYDGREGKKQKPATDSGDAVPALVRGIRAGTTATAGLGKESRRASVERLTAEGHSILEIAEALGVSDRTIRRDLREIRTAHAIERDPQTVKETVGRVVRQAELTVDRIRRSVRPKGVKASERIQAEYACWRIVKDLVGILQRLGYLPTAPLQVHGDVTHKVSLEIPGWEELETELDRLETIESEHAPDGERLAQIGQLRAAVKGLAVVDQVESLALTMREESNDEEE